VEFLLKKERVFFFRGSALQVFGQCGEAKCGLGFAKTIFWGFGFGKTEANLFLDFVRAEEGSGEESARASFSLFFDGHQDLQNTPTSCYPLVKVDSITN